MMKAYDLLGIQGMPLYELDPIRNRMYVRFMEGRIRYFQYLEKKEHAQLPPIPVGQVDMESYDLDGEIVYDRTTDLFEVTRPCGKDEGSDWCIRRTKEHFWSVIREGFPDRRRVVTG